MNLLFGDGAYMLSTVLQNPGDTVFVPKDWWHATCALDDWTVAVGMQKGSPHSFQQKFKPLPQPFITRNNHHHNQNKKKQKQKQNQKQRRRLQQQQQRAQQQAQQQA